MKRHVRTPTGSEAVAYRLPDYDWEVADSVSGVLLGYLRQTHTGSHHSWGIYLMRPHGAVTGRYVDMGHAVDGLLARRGR